jgi:hypothetical protein
MNVGLNSIFQKNADGTYTDNALLYQYILRYSLIISNQQSVERINIDRLTFTHRNLLFLLAWFQYQHPSLQALDNLEMLDMVQLF